MGTVMLTVVFVTAIGAVCAVLLCIASKAMHVETDERVAQIVGCLPGSNCGACGYPGCAGYAEAIAGGSGASINLCTPGGAEVRDRLSAILGVDGGDVIKKVAVVHCVGDCISVPTTMDYKGIQTCKAAKQLYGGGGACAYGCLGYGDCVSVCPIGAICVKDELARVNAHLCNGCGLCVKSCPNGLIAIIDANETAVVCCRNCDRGAAARKKCQNACLGCRRCARECPSGAIVISDNLARIDYEKCQHCAHCAETCVAHCIRLLRLQ